MKTIDFSYFIERYIAGEMDEAEKKWFHKELDGNEKLRREVYLRQKTDSILNHQDVMDLRMKLKSIEKSREEKLIPMEAAVRRKKRANTKYAGIITCLLIIGGFAVFHNGKLSNDAIIENYYKSYEVTAYSRSGNSVINSDYNLALEYYKIHDYRNAAIYFSKVLENDPGNMNSVFLNGISNFENSNYPAAKSSFQKVIRDNNNLYIDHAQWYLALCYIKTDEEDKAKIQLKEIVKSDGFYKKEAKKVLRQLK